MTDIGSRSRRRNIDAHTDFFSCFATLGKDFALLQAGFLHEGSKLSIRANFFNAFNILNLTPLIPASAPTDILNPASFGRPSDGLAGRVIELQARVSF